MIFSFTLDTLKEMVLVLIQWYGKEKIRLQMRVVKRVHVEGWQLGRIIVAPTDLQQEGLGLVL